jgi:uncharacterized protein
VFENETKRRRILGFDVARALAVFGMVIVNYRIAMDAKEGGAFWLGFAQLFEGRASALFVVLAGVGVTFLTRNAIKLADGIVTSKARIALIRRGLLLVVVGLSYTPIWAADILHFYGLYFLLAALIFRSKSKTLFQVSIVIMLAFPVLLLMFDYEQNWNWSTLTYQNLWSIDGIIRHMFFNGFHPFFPWAGFLVFGMWLARLQLDNKAVRKRLLTTAIMVLLVSEFSFSFLRTLLYENELPSISSDVIQFLFSTSAIPPMPQYMISSASSAVVVLICCLNLSERFSSSNLTNWLSQTGKMALTLYVAHVVIGMGFLESIGRLNSQTIEFALLSSLIFCIGGVVF